MPLPFYKSPTLLLGWGLSPFVFWRLWKIRPDVIHAAFPGLPPPFSSMQLSHLMQSISVVWGRTVYSQSRLYLRNGRQENKFADTCQSRGCTVLVYATMVIISEPLSSMHLLSQHRSVLLARESIPTAHCLQGLSSSERFYTPRYSASRFWCRTIPTSRSISHSIRGQAWWSPCGKSFVSASDQLTLPSSSPASPRCV